MKQNKYYKCHSGGAEGADSYFEFFSKQYRVAVVAYSYKTRFHRSENKYELNETEFKEGVDCVYKANEVLKRSRINPYLKLLARNWFQVKYAQEVFAISTLKKQNDQFAVKGGTAWAVQMAIDAHKRIFVFDQDRIQWFYYDYALADFSELKTEPKITAQDFTGIGTRNINFFGMAAVEQLFRNTFD